MLDHFFLNIEEYVLIGNMNLKIMLNRNISETLIEICDVVDLKNMVKKLHVLLKIQNLLW
jgi:hypothetical protein